MRILCRLRGVEQLSVVSRRAVISVIAIVTLVAAGATLARRKRATAPVAAATAVAAPTRVGRARPARERASPEAAGTAARLGPPPIARLGSKDGGRRTGPAPHQVDEVAKKIQVSIADTVVRDAQRVCAAGDCHRCNILRSALAKMYPGAAAQAQIPNACDGRSGAGAAAPPGNRHG
jgi:hypothetical protein